MKFNSTLHAKRFGLGIISLLVPILSICFTLIGIYVGGEHIEYIYSISATYYSSSKVIYISSLALASFFFINL